MWIFLHHSRLGDIKGKVRRLPSQSSPDDGHSIRASRGEAGVREGNAFSPGEGQRLTRNRSLQAAYKRALSAKVSLHLILKGIQLVPEMPHVSPGRTSLNKYAF